MRKVEKQIVAANKSRGRRRIEKTPSVVIEAQAGPLSVQPLRVLLEMAEAYTPSWLPDWMANASLHWGWLRYLWAFGRPAASGAMSLNDYATSLYGHHRALLSEHLGVGVGLAVADELLIRQGATRFARIDIDELMPSGGAALLGLAQSPRVKVRPDYLLSAQDALGTPLLLGVECKGTFVAGHHLVQLASGVRQLRGLMRAGSLRTTGSWRHWTSPPGVVVATNCQADLATFVVDPPEEDRREDRQATPSDTEDELDEDRPVGLLSSGRVLVRDNESTRSFIERLDAASTMAYAGLYSDAARARESVIGGPGGGRPARNSRLARRTSDGMEFSGTTRAVDGVEVFCGVESALLESMREGSDAQAVLERERLAEMHSAGVQGEDQTAVSPRGTALSIRRSSRRRGSRKT